MNKHIVLIVAAILLLISTTYIPTYVKNDSGLKDVSFGYPVGFITQDFSDYTGSVKTPVNVKFSTTRLQAHPERSKINQTMFLINLLVIFGILEGIFYYTENIYTKK